MPNKFWFFMPIVLLCFNFSLNGQSDTVYIYENVIEYDTVYVHDTIFIKPDLNPLAPVTPLIGILQLDTFDLKANLLLISGSQTATIPIYRVIIDENFKKLKSMKKLSFLGVVFFAFQSMVMSQTEFGISVGSGTWYQSSSKEFVDKPMSPLVAFGAYAKRNILNNSFAIKTGLNYHYLKSTGKYKYGTPGSPFHRLFYEFSDGLNYAAVNFRDVNNLYGNDMHYLSFPLQLYWTKFRIQPYLGMNYNFFWSNSYELNTTREKLKHTSQNIGINAGLAYHLSNNFSIEFSYLHNLSYDYGEGAGGSGRNGDGTYFKYSESIFMSNNQLLFSVIYNFGQNKESENKP